jgi:hypothetical protein
MITVNNRVLVSYKGQPATCYGCGETGRQYHERPKRKPTFITNADELTSPNTWADLFARNGDKAGPSVMLKRGHTTNARNGQRHQVRWRQTRIRGIKTIVPTDIWERPSPCVGNTDGRGCTQPSQRVVKWSETP